MRSRFLFLPLMVLSAAIGYANGTFDFSYTFSGPPGAPGDTFGGTFTGTKNGNLVTIGSITSVWVNDPLQTLNATVIGGYDLMASDWSAPAVMSFTALLENNFDIRDDIDGTNFEFSISPFPGGDVNAFGMTTYGSDVDGLNSSPGVWSLTEETPTSSVPDGGSTAVMLFGSFAVLGLLRKRR